MRDIGQSAQTGVGRRRAVLAGIGWGCLPSLSGCTGSSRVLGGAGSSTVTIEFVEVAGSRSKETFRPAIEELNAERDETVELEFVEVPYQNIRSELSTRVGGGNAPDVAAIDQIWLGQFVDADVLLPLDGVADDVDVDDFLEPFVETARFDGRLYALPTTTDVRGMYWNRRAFADAGLDPDDPPETWAELLSYADRLHDPPERYGAAFFVSGGRWTVPLFAAGGRVLDEDGTAPRFHEPSGVAAADFLDELYNDGAVGPPEPLYQDGAQAAREFLRGQYAITVVEGSWLDYYWRNLGNDAAAMVDRFGFAPTPRPADGRRATMSGGHLWAAFDGTDHPDVVRDFLRIVAGREFMRHLAIEAGQIPTRTSLQDDDAVWDDVLYADEVRALLEDTRLRPVRNWSVVANALEPALERVAFDRGDPETALAEAATEVESSLQ